MQRICLMRWEEKKKKKKKPKALPSHFPPFYFTEQGWKLHACASVGVKWLEGHLPPPRSVLFLVFHFLCGSCFAVQVWFGDSDRHVCMCVCVESLHSAGLRRNINHRRWLLWNLITLIICTSRLDSRFHASACVLAVYLHLELSCARVYDAVHVLPLDGVTESEGWGWQEGVGSSGGGGTDRRGRGQPFLQWINTNDSQINSREYWKCLQQGVFITAPQEVLTFKQQPCRMSEHAALSRFNMLTRLCRLAILQAITIQQ